MRKIFLGELNRSPLLFLFLFSPARRYPTRGKSHTENREYLILSPLKLLIFYKLFKRFFKIIRHYAHPLKKYRVSRYI